MEHSSDPRKISRDQKCIGALERTVPLRAGQGTKLRDMLMSDKPNLSYADFHHQLTRDQDNTIPNYIGTQQTRPLERVTSKEGELVRYMSNLPSYLEKGNNFQDKALNVGVLDWKRLEKWRYRQKQLAHKHNGSSPSSSNTPYFSPDGSSTHSSRAQSSSPADRRMPLLSLHTPPEASRKEGYVPDSTASSSRDPNCSSSSQGMHSAVLQSHAQKVYEGRVKSKEIDVFGGNLGKFSDLNVSSVNHLGRQQKALRALQRGERKESDMKSVSEMGQLLTFDECGSTAPWKGKAKVQGFECAIPTAKLQEAKAEAADRNSFKRESSLILPIDLSENGCSGVVNGQFPMEANQKTTLGTNDVENLLPYKTYDRRQSDQAGSCFQNPVDVKSSSNASHKSAYSTKRFHSPSKISAQDVKGPSQASHMLSFPARMFSSPTRSRNKGEKKRVTGIESPSTGMPPSDVVNVRKSTESIPQVRNSSPIRRLSFAMGKMIKNAGSRDSSPLRKASSKDCVPKSGPEGAVTSSIDHACSDKFLSNNHRGRSSPLRRLLDPLLKSRASNCSEPANKHSNDQSDFCAGPSVKVKSRSSCNSASSASDSHLNSKNVSSSLQALLQVSFKNGLPLFTFAIDNESDILAATVRKSFVPMKGHHNWTYTFFTVREIKRKSGNWLNQGPKGDRHGYVPNVVARMKVSDSCDSPSTMHENTDEHITREFDLFAVDIGNGDQYATDFHPTNELAAIVVKLPRMPSVDPCKDDQTSYSWLDLSFGGNLQETTPFTGFPDDLQDHQFFQNVNFSANVILPGGIHTVSSKGEISTLARRWRSCGSCDCGGWDLGCQLRVYTNQREFGRNVESSVSHLSENKFQSFSLVGQDNQPVLSLAPFTERIYSVEFNSSLSLLQAFAVCISFVDCRRPAELSEPSNVVEKISSEIGVFEVPLPTKTSNHQIGAPARYVSYPPYSPVGRV